MAAKVYRLCHRRHADTSLDPLLLGCSEKVSILMMRKPGRLLKCWKSATMLNPPLTTTSSFFLLGPKQRSGWFVILLTPCSPWVTFQRRAKWFISEEMSEGEAGGMWWHWQGVKGSKTRAGRFDRVVRDSARESSYLDEAQSLSLACFCFLLMFVSASDLASNLRLLQMLLHCHESLLRMSYCWVRDGVSCHYRWFYSVKFRLCALRARHMQNGKINTDVFGTNTIVFPKTALTGAILCFILFP